MSQGFGIADFGLGIADFGISTREKEDWGGWKGNWSFLGL